MSSLTADLTNRISPEPRESFADLEQSVKLLRSLEDPAAEFVTKLTVLCRDQKLYDKIESEFVKVCIFRASNKKTVKKPLEQENDDNIHFDRGSKSVIIIDLFWRIK